MSTSLLYHGWGTENYRYLRTEYGSGAVWFHIERKPNRRWCTVCKSSDVILDGRNPERVLQTTPIGTRRVYLVLQPQRLRCYSCGARRQEPLEIAEPLRSFTKRLGAYSLELCRKNTVSDSAHFAGLPWQAVAELLTEELEARAKRISWSGLRYIAIDEVSVGKGQDNYLTVVLDLDKREVVYVADTRKKEALKPFFTKLRRCRTRLKAVAMDMHEPFRLAVEEYYVHRVDIVYDNFHIIKLFNEELDDIRREEVRRMENAEGKKLIKGARYILLRGQENLLPNAQQRLKALLKVNENLNKAYILKETLRDIRNIETRWQAEVALKDWVAQALGSGVPGLVKFATTLVKHWNGVLNYYRHPISTGPLEATNNKIQLLKRKAFGYRNRHFLKLRILFVNDCQSKVSGT